MLMRDRELRDFGIIRPTGIRQKGAPSQGSINTMPETLGLKPVGRDGAKRTIALRPRATALHKTSALHARRCVHSGKLMHGNLRQFS